MSDGPHVWQPHSPNARIAKDAARTKSDAILGGWENFWSTYLTCGRCGPEWSQVNPKFGLSRPFLWQMSGVAYLSRANGKEAIGQISPSGFRPSRRIQRRI